MAEKKLKTQNLKSKTTTQKAKAQEKKGVGLKSKKNAEAKTEMKAEKSAGVSVEVVNLTGASVGKMTLPGEIFSAKINPVLMAQAVRVYLANQRSGTASTKTRGEVRGSTRKIYRQKGTGKARHGGIRAPIFVGGGIVFGPRPRDFSLKMPKKMRQKALFSALTEKLTYNKVIIADKFETVSGKTSEVQKALKAMNVTNKQGKGDKVLFVTPGKAEITARGLRNIEGVFLMQAENISTYDVVNSNHIVLMKDAIETMKKTFLGEK